jgi:CBS domain containing-hemolysin-like protein
MVSGLAALAWVTGHGGRVLAAGMAAGGTVAGGYTSTDVTLLAAYVLLALVFSFLCSVAEAVLLSITPSYIAGLADTHPGRAALLKRLKQDKVDQSLAAILTLNTIAHTVGAIGSGAKATAVFGSAWFGLFSAVMTLMILFLSEIIPKTIGAVYWRALAAWTAQFVRVLIWVLYPLIRVSEALTRLVARGKKPHAFSRDEFVALAGIGQRAGKIDDYESGIIRNLFRLGSLTAEDIMTPRTVIAGLPQEMTVEAALSRLPAISFSRLPIYQKDLDHITGFILKDDLLLAAARNQSHASLDSLKREMAGVSGQMPLPDLFEAMIGQRRHMVRVYDRYGGTLGLATTEDVIETLLGLEIVDENDRVEDMQALARRQWEKRSQAKGAWGESGQPGKPAAEAPKSDN